MRRHGLLSVGALVLAACGDGGVATPDSESSSGESSSSSTTTIDPDSSSSTETPTTADSSTTIDPDSSTSVDPSESSSSSSETGDLCGNGVLDAGEACDGDELAGEDCVSQGFLSGALACANDCTLDVSECHAQHCGDNEIEGTEDCEGVHLNGQHCETLGFDDGELACQDCVFDTSDCIYYTCSNNLQEGAEVCDGTDLDFETCITQGFASGTLSCAANCAAFDTSACLTYLCGNDNQEDPEICDGDDFAGETCASQGFVAGTLGCADNCLSFDTSACNMCGNGIIDPGETCDGADLGGEDCITSGYDAGTLACTSDCNALSVSGCVTLTTLCTSPSAAIGPDAGALTISTIDAVGLVGAVLDVDISVTATHGSVGDLDIGVRHVASDTSVALAAQACGAANDIDATFDEDAAAPPDCIEPNAIEGEVLPAGDLDAYVGIAGNGNGTWELSIADQADGDGGTLTQWCVEITSAAESCGDGAVQGEEHCDDANASDGDGCSSDCAVELHYRCVGGGAGSCAPIDIMYLLADFDDPTFRSDIAAVTGGVVDYVDAQFNTPSVAELAAYDCVFTHPNYTYGDSFTLGDNLADYVDGGGTVVLGIATDYLPPTGLAGTTIMGASYSPVTTSGGITGGAASYADDGTTPIHDSIVDYGGTLWDFGVALQGSGIQDGSLDVGEIATAYRPDFKVVYVNGTGESAFTPNGEWGRLIANACAAGYVQ